MNLLRLLLAASTIAVLPACTDPLESSAPPVADAGPPLADAAPPGTPGLTATWKPGANLGFSNLVATSAGDEGAVAYLEYRQGDNTVDPASRVVLQRLDALGLKKGAPVEIAAMQAPALAHLTLASDGSKYLACWEQSEKIACASVPLGSGEASAALTVVGSAPALAHGAGGFALAYAASGHVALARVASDLQAAGAPVTIAVDGAMKIDVALAATPGGFALVRGPRADVASAYAYRLDGAFATLGAPVDLGSDLWWRMAIATAGDHVVVALAKPYGGKLVTLDAGALTSAHALVGGVKLGLEFGLGVDGTAVAMVAADDGGGIRSRRVEGGVVTMAKDPQEKSLGDFVDGSLATLEIHGDVFVAATPGYVGNPLFVLRVQRP